MLRGKNQLFRTHEKPNRIFRRRFFFTFCFFPKKNSVFLSMVFEALKAKADGVSYGVAFVLLTCYLRVSLSC